jgi:hypothetical protein
MSSSLHHITSKASVMNIVARWKCTDFMDFKYGEMGTITHETFGYLRQEIDVCPPLIFAWCTVL